jgi:hypothetical protein
MLKHLYLKRKSPQKQLNRRPGGLDAVEKKKYLSSYRNQTLAIQSIAHYYTN